MCYNVVITKLRRVAPPCEKGDFFMQLPRLKSLRQERGFKQITVSRELGLTQQTYSRYENGTLQPGIEVIVKLSKFYGVSTDYILGLTDVRELRIKN